MRNRIALVLLIVVAAISLVYQNESGSAQSRTIGQFQNVAFSSINVGNPPIGSVRYVINARRKNGPCEQAGVGETPIGSDALKTPNGWMCSSRAAGVGEGSVISFSAGDLSPLFTTTEATVTTTPALTFSLNTQAANVIFAGPTTGAAAAPTWRALVAADILATVTNSKCVRVNSSGVLDVAADDCGTGSGGGLADPGSNGIIKRTALNVTAPAVAGTDYLLPAGSGAALTGITFSQLGGMAADSQIPNSITINLATLATTATTAEAGDTATLFFAAGTIEAARLPALSTLSGAVTDAQVPDTITVDLATTATTATLGDNAGGFFSAGTLEAVRGGTGLGAPGDDQLLVGNGTIFEFKTLPSCSNATDDKLLYNSTTNTFSCGADQASGGGSGITSLNTLTGATQTFSKTDDTNVTLTLTPSGTDHNFALGWTGTLADARVADNITLTNITQITNRAVGDTTGDIAASRVDDGAVAATQALFSGAGSAAGFRAIADADVPNTITIDLAAVSGAGDSATAFFSAGTIEAARLPDAVADGATKGIASFTAADFNATTGNISIDYTNGQAATGSVKGFLTAADWTIFNDKVSAGSVTSSALTMNTARMLGRTIASVGAVEELTAAQAKTFLAVAFTDVTGSVTDAQVPNTITVDLATTVTTNANLTGMVTSVGNAAVLGSFTLAQLSTAVSDANIARIDAGQTFTGTQVLNGLVEMGTAGSIAGSDGLIGSGVALVISGSSGTSGPIFGIVSVFDAGGAAGPDAAYMAAGSRGSVSAPTALQSGDQVGGIAMAGYGTSQFNNVAFIKAYADENFTNTTAATHLEFRTTPTGSVTALERMRITSAGVLQLGVAGGNIGQINLVGTTADAPVIKATGDDAVVNLKLECKGTGCSVTVGDPSGSTSYVDWLASAAPATPASGTATSFVGTNKTWKLIDDAGNISTTVRADTGASNNFLTAISVDGVISKAQPSFANLSGSATAAQLGTGSGGAVKFLREDSTWQTITGGGDALVGSPLSQFAATTSAQLAGVLSDESGSAGGFVRATGATLTTPNIGAATGTSLVVSGDITAAAFISTGLGPGYSQYNEEGGLGFPALVANTVQVTTVADVAAGGIQYRLAGTAATGFRFLTNVSGVMTESIVAAVTDAQVPDNITIDLAAAATALANARTIGGVSFNGTANITVASATGGFAVSGGNLTLGTDLGAVFDEHASAPGTPSSGNVILYAKQDGLLYSKDDAGTETVVTGGGGGGGAPTDATYITQTANGTLSAEQALGALATGVLASTTTSGVVASRVLTGTSGAVSITSGDGSANPTFTLPAAITVPTSYAIGSDPADAGVLRLENAAVIGWEASPAGTDVTLTVNSSEQFVFSAAILSPTFVTPALGTPASGVATNLTGTAAGFTAGNVTTNANLTGMVTSIGNAAILGSFTFAQLNAAVSDADVARTDAANTFTGVQTMTSPSITTSLVTGSTTFALVNTTATTVNAFGAATTLNFGASATQILNFGGSTTASEFRFLEPSGSGTNYSAFKAVAQAASITYSLPPSVVAGGALTDVAGNGVLTWVVPSGSGTITAGATNAIPKYTASTTIDDSGVTIDGSNNMVIPGSLTVTSLIVGDGTVAGESLLNEIAANGSEYFSWLGPDARTTVLRALVPSADPSAGNVMIFGAPSSTISTVTFGGLSSISGAVTDGQVPNSITVDLATLATTVTTNANLTGHVTSTGNAAVLGSFTAAQLNAAISDADIQPLDSDLTSMAALATNGLVVRVTTGSISTRSIVGTANEITVSNGDGVSANPTLSLPATIDLSGKTSLALPNAAAPTVDAFAEIAGDNNLWAASRGAPVFFDGTAPIALVGALVSDTPTNGQVPTWNTGGTITWETPAGSGTVTATGGALTLNALMLGADGTDSKVMASLGTTTTVLHGNAAGAPTFGAVSLTADVSGTLPVANGGTGITSLGSGVATFWGTPSSANLAAAVTGETGSGALVFGTSPDFTTAITLGGVAVPTISSTSTFTNKTLDAEGTGNVITLSSKIILKAAAGTAAAASLMMNALAANAPTAACSAGSTETTMLRCVADFPDSDGDYSLQDDFLLPSDWTGVVDVKILWRAAATTGDAVWQITTSCRADAEVDDAAFSTASSVTDTVKGTTNQLNTATLTISTSDAMATCAAGENAHIKVFRNRTHASDSIAGVISLSQVELTARRQQ